MKSRKIISRSENIEKSKFYCNSTTCWWYKNKKPYVYLNKNHKVRRKAYNNLNHTLSTAIEITMKQAILNFPNLFVGS